ncbi:MAG: hypothetical protein OCD01_20275 [Fibrobacterales bacterium]
MSDITDVFSTGSVIGTDGYIGGLIGDNSGGNITNSHFVGKIKGTHILGALVFVTKVPLNKYQ